MRREAQGAGRHDNPDHYAALYASRVPESAVAERIQQFRGQELSPSHLRRADGNRLALAAIDDARAGGLVNLDDPGALAQRDLRPSTVATRMRAVTRRVARGLFFEGASGFEWWSTLEASWTNVTLFLERAGPGLSLPREPETLELDHPVLRAAAEALGVGLGR